MAIANRKRSLPIRQRLAELRPTDRAVLLYLNELRKNGKSDTFTVGIPTIAAACSISPRQVQVSTGRLIKADLLERIGYDFGNVDRSRRGTKYKLLVKQTAL
ncbi:MAG: helix-turn-helix domain-containing protein, partial [Acidobacteriota bacterium]|nr:helix-turn-helix domain-containing protein [Acidobacteriota bacterium]